MNDTSGDDPWATACAQILTTPGAREADVEACRALMLNHQQDVSWPFAFALVGGLAAAAWGFPRVIRAFWGH
jgi:hypothetical protein